MAPNVPSVPLKEYRHAPFFADDALMNMLQEVDGTAANPCAQPPFAPDGDADPLEAPIIAPESVLRLRIDRGDFPYSHIIFESYPSGTSDWGAWVAHVISKQQYCAILEKCGLYRMVERFSGLELPKHNEALTRLVSRWSTETHTFITSWGEFTVTLEDVVQLLGLEPVGEVSYYADIREAETVVDCLSAWFGEAIKFAGVTGSQTSKTSFVQWQRYCFRETTKVGVYDGALLGHKYHLATFLLAFLSRFVAPGRATDCPRRSLFRMAALLSLGHRLPMAQFFLGNLYFQLDEIHTASERSGGRYDVGSYVHGSFLTAFLYERFRGFAPKVKDIPFAKDEVPIRIERWHEAISTDKINFYMDNEGDFAFRAYHSPGSFWSYPFFEKEAWLYDHPTHIVETWLLGSKAATLNVIFPSFLPYLTEDGAGYVNYNPHRCWRQLGFDQVVPLEYFEDEVDQEQGNRLAWSFHTIKGLFQFCGQHDQQEMPSAGREGSPSESWYLYWARQAQLFINFVDGAPATLKFPDVGTDNVLRKQKSKVAGWRGPLSPFLKAGEGEPPAKKQVAPPVVPSKAASEKTSTMSKKSTSTISPKQKVPSKKASPPAVLPPPPPVTRGRTTRVRSKKRSRDEDLSNFVPIEEETGLSKREQALEQIRLAKRSKKESGRVAAGPPAIAEEESAQGQLAEYEGEGTGSKEVDPASVAISKVINVPGDPCVSLSLARLQRTLNYSAEDLLSYHYVGAGYRGEVYPASKKVWSSFSFDSVADQLKASLQVPTPASEGEAEGIDDLTLQEMVERAKLAVVAAAPEIERESEEEEEEAEKKEEEIGEKEEANEEEEATKTPVSISLIDTGAEIALPLGSPGAKDMMELPQTMGALVVREQITPTPSEIEDQASPEKVAESSSSAEKISCKFEHLWEGLALSEEAKHFLRLYANLDCGPFIVIEKTQFKTFQKAQIESLGGLLTELCQWSFSRLESDESKQFETLIAQLEGFGVPCKLLKTRLNDLRIVRPAETRALLSRQSEQCNVLASQQDTLLKRKKEIAKRIGDLRAEIQSLEGEAKTTDTLLEAAERDLARADEERAKAFDLIAPHMTQSNPLAALMSVMDFFLS